MTDTELSILTDGPPAPIEVRDAAYRLVATGAGTHEMEPGVYLVRARLPGRDPISEVVTLGGGQTTEVRLDLSIEPTTSPRIIREAFATGDEEGVVMNVGYDATPARYEEATREASGAPVDVPAADEPWPSGSVPEWRLQILAANGLLGVPEPSPALVDVVDPSGWSAELRVSVPPGQAAFAQILLAGEVPLFVGLVGNGITPQVTLVPTEAWSHRSVKALPADDRARRAMEFLSSGQARSGAEVISAETAGDMLGGKVQDPIGAALGGYLLLRLGALDPMRGWAENLANWFPWLPDGAVIAGELAAQEGNAERALRRFLELETRGLPLLTEGFSVALHRLRRYARKKALPAKANERARRLLELLRGWTPYLDLSAPTLTFRAGELNDPRGSQAPASADPSHGDWVFVRDDEGRLAIRRSD